MALIFHFVCLISDNYYEWAFRIKNFLIARNFRIINDNATDFEKETIECEAWKAKNRKVLSYIG